MFQTEANYKYELPEDGYSNNWTDGNGRQPEHPLYTPKKRQLPIIEAVKHELQAGTFYSSDLRDGVARLLHVDHEIRMVGANRVEGGYFGMEVYIASRYVEAQRHYKNKIDVFNELSLAEGELIGAIIFNDGKLINNAKVIGVNKEELCFVLSGKRGAHSIQFECDPDGLKRSIDRAHDYKKRKASYDKFINRKSSNQFIQLPVVNSIDENQFVLF